MVYEKIDNYLTDAKLTQTNPLRDCEGIKKIKERLIFLSRCKSITRLIRLYFVDS